MTTDADRAAQAKLDEAVETYIREMGWNGTEDMGLVTTAWVMVAHQTGWDVTDTSHSGYLLIYKGGSQPDHVARGLFGQGLDIVRHIGRYEREGDGDEES